MSPVYLATAVEQLGQGIRQDLAAQGGGLDLQHAPPLPQVVDGRFILRLDAAGMHPLDGALAGVDQAGRWKREWHPVRDAGQQ